LLVADRDCNAVIADALVLMLAMGNTPLNLLHDTGTYRAFR
jgi:hypothetical protein